MQMYRCILKRNAIRLESFYMRAESAQDLKEHLERFQWPKGQWEIEDIESEDE